jgi:hypothetical protein
MPNRYHSNKLDYLSIRGNEAGPLFITEDRQPLRRETFAGITCIFRKQRGVVWFTKEFD